MSEREQQPGQRRRKPRPNLRKLMFVLPNLFTVMEGWPG